METKFNELLKLNVNDKTEKRKSGKQELTYLSWAWAWAEFKKVYPDASYEIKKFKQTENIELPYMYDPATGYMVMTSVTAGGLTYEMWLPVMNTNNKAMKPEPYEYTTQYGTFKVDTADMFDVNKTIMRCLTKNLAMFGLGLYIYAGEDLPEGEKSAEQPKKEEPKVEHKPQQTEGASFVCSECGKAISQKVYEYSTKHKGKALCMDCQKK